MKCYGTVVMKCIKSIKTKANKKTYPCRKIDTTATGLCLIETAHKPCRNKTGSIKEGES